MVQSMLSMHDSWIRSLAPHKQGVGMHACFPSTQEAEAKGSEVLDFPQLLNEFKVSLRYLKHCVKIDNHNIPL